MTEIMAARDVSLFALEQKFNLRLVEDEQFFPEWSMNLPEITDQEKQLLDRVKAGYFNLVKYPPRLENVVKMSVLVPLLYLADFYLYPFHIKMEEAIKLVGSG